MTNPTGPAPDNGLDQPLVHLDTISTEPLPSGPGSPGWQAVPVHADLELDRRAMRCPMSVIRLAGTIGACFVVRRTRP